MNQLLVAIDFSTRAYNAAQYALKLGEVLKSKVILFNAYNKETKPPQANEDLTIGPLPVDSKLDCFTNLDESVADYVDCRCELGSLTAVVNQITSTERINLVVMGMSYGENSQEIIDYATCPVLLVPANSTFKKLNKIAFATDLNERDIPVIHSLVSLARYFHAEILLVHVSEQGAHLKTDQQKVNAFLSDVTCKINYSQIYYRHINSDQIDEGLAWLSTHGFIDMMVMVHRESKSDDSLFGGSHTKKMASHIDVPLLVFPEKYTNTVF